MKNLKKLISVIIAVIMLVSSFATVAAADYADVESTNSYAKAIKVLSGLGIAQGDDEGNFNPQNDVKRSEMVAFVCRAMGEEDIATASSSNAFTDVAANHWAAGYIAWGVNRGIINGMGDGTFAPDASVTYQDAVVMIMRALGYDRIAQRAENGGYPTGYLKLASQYGVLKDAGYDNAKAATREIIAQLIYNALTAPLVDVSYYGVSVEDDRYVIYNGKNGYDLRTLLTFSNDIIKVKATIDETPKANPTTCIDKAGNYSVKITVVDGYDYKEAAAKELFGVDGSGNIINAGYAYVGETEAADLLGSTVEAYLVEDEALNDWKLLAVVADSKTVVEETITENLNTIVVDTTNNIVKYYADLQDRKMTEIDIVATPTVYYNGVVVSSSDLASVFTNLETLLKSHADSITFMGAKNADYDKIFVTDYIYKVVKSVNADSKLIKLDPTGTVDLNAESRGDEDFIYGLYDANGKAMDIADIAEGDILNIVCPLDGTTKGNYFAADYLDIYVTNETVTGAVKEIKNGKYVIDGEAYATEGVTPALGEEGTFYLSIDGKIIKKEASSSITKNFAYIAAIDSESSFGKTAYTVKLFTADGEATYKVADKVKFIDGTASAVVYKVEDNSQEKLLGDYAGVACSESCVGDHIDTCDFEAAGSVFYDLVYTADHDGDMEDDTLKTTFAESAASEGDAAGVALENAQGRFITFKTDSNGAIIEIRRAGGSTAELIAKAKNARYDADFEEFGGEDIGEAPLFVVPTTVAADGSSATIDLTKLTLGTFSALDEDETYNTSLYMVDGEKELSAVLMVDELNYASKTAPLAVVAAQGTRLDANENEVYSYTIVQSGKTKTLNANYDEYPSGLGLEPGDIFQYAVNADDEIIEIHQVYDQGTSALVSTYVHSADDIGFVFGAIAEFGGDYIVLTKEFTADASGSVTNTTDESKFMKFGAVEAEGATYAWFEDKAGVNNPVKLITVDGIRETVNQKEVFAAVAKVNENEKIEDIIVIAIDPATMDTVGEISGFGNWDLAY